MDQADTQGVKSYSAPPIKLFETLQFSLTNNPGKRWNILPNAPLSGHFSIQKKIKKTKFFNSEIYSVAVKNPYSIRHNLKLDEKIDCIIKKTPHHRPPYTLYCKPQKMLIYVLKL